MIKINMLMPENCLKCPFYIDFHGGICLASGKRGLYFGDTDPDIDRHNECPLMEVDE